MVECSHIPNNVMRTDNRISILDLRHFHVHHELYVSPRRISDEFGFGEDPLQGNNTKISIRARAFHDRYPSYDAIFHDAVNLNPILFKSALLFYIDVTYRLSRS